MLGFNLGRSNMLIRDDVVNFVLKNKKNIKSSLSKNDLESFFNTIDAPKDNNLPGFGLVLRGVINVFPYMLEMEMHRDNNEYKSCLLIARWLIDNIQTNNDGTSILNSNKRKDKAIARKIDRKNEHKVFQGCYAKYSRYCMLGVFVDDRGFLPAYNAIKAQVFDVMCKHKVNQSRCDSIGLFVRNMARVSIDHIKNIYAEKTASENKILHEAITNQKVLENIHHNHMSRKEFILLVQDKLSGIRPGSLAYKKMKRLEGILRNRFHIKNNKFVNGNECYETKTSEKGLRTKTLDVVWKGWPIPLDDNAGFIVDLVPNEISFPGEEIDDDEGEFVVITRPGVHNTRSGAFTMQELAIRKAQISNHIAMASNGIVDHSVQLSIKDISVFEKKVMMHYMMGSRYRDACLMLVVSFFIGRTISDLNNDQVRLNLIKKHIEIPAVFECHKVKPEDIYQEYVCKTVDKIVLPMPKMLCILLEEYEDTDKDMFFSITDLTIAAPVRYTNSCKKILNKWNYECGTRLTLSRISDYLHKQIKFNSNGGEVSAAALTGKVTINAKTPFIYRAIRAFRLESLYRDIVYNIPISEKLKKLPLLINTNKDIWVGAKNAVKQDVVNHFVLGLIEKTIKHKRKNIIERINAFTFYCVCMYVWHTMYRGVKNPLPFITNIDFVNKTTYVDDKNHLDESQSKVVSLSEILVKQMKGFINFLDDLAIFSKENIPKLYESLRNDKTFKMSTYNREKRRSDAIKNNIFGFFIINSDLSIRQIYPSDIEKWIQEFWPFRVHDNRATTSTCLFDMGCPENVINRIMGHFGYGSEISAVYSFYNQQAYNRVFKKYIDEIVYSQGWKLIKAPVLEL